MTAIVHMKNGERRTVEVTLTEMGGISLARLPESAEGFLAAEIPWQEVETVDLCVDFATAKAGEEGYLVLPRGRSGVGDDCLCYFRPRQDCEVVTEGPEMTMYGMIAEGRSFLAVVTGMTYDYALVAKVENQVYSVFPRFLIHGRKPYEAIEVCFQRLQKDADYNDVAHAYRDWRVKKGEIRPIREREKEQEVLKEAVRSPFIRIRMGWKPVPTPVLEQTPETEPEMKVACTFDDVIALIEECHRQGIEHAEFCLVGWNRKGHDGRWPQIFPVEPALGGEEKLKELIRRAKELGYLIVCHTNSTDAYSIADNWNEEDLVHLEDGRVSQNATSWSGGAMYDICPAVALKQAEKELPRVAALGFCGLHYVDVISTVPPRSCYSPEHPVTARQCVEYWRRIMRLSRKLFGGFSSEGGYDFAAPDMDFGLYISFGDKGCPLSDRFVPLWYLVYHGYVMGNPYTTTVNPDADDWLKVVEYGGRPAIYFYSQFVTPTKDRGNWMGTLDYACHTPKERKESVERIAATCRAYGELSWLQEEFMERHREIAPGVFEILYSDGSRIEMDYNKKSYRVQKGGK